MEKSMHPQARPTAQSLRARTYRTLVRALG
jgi:hypothetical protein